MGFKGIRVLLVEDDLDDAFLTRKALSEITDPQFDVDHAENLTEAVAHVRGGSYDVVLLDLGLPESIGTPTVAKFREMAGRATPVVVLTGNANRDAAYKTLDEGAQDYVVKSELRPETLGPSIQYAIHRQQLLDQLHAANELLEKKNQHLADLYETAHQFVDNVSHEFRTPLTVIREFTSIIRDGIDGPVTPKQIDHLDKVMHRTDDLALMVDDMLDISKLEAGLLGVWRRPCSAADLVDHVTELLQGRAASRKIDLVTDVDPDLPEILCDQEKVERVIINLAVNAIKFSSEGSRVEIWARPTAFGRDIAIGVSDTGPGISKANLDSIFDRFQQVGGNIRSSTKGFGLGLNIAKELVGLNLGQMHVESELGKGSTFSFTIPSNDPVGILDRFLDRTETVADSETPVSLIVVRPTTNPTNAEPVIDEFLQRTVRGQDLVLRLAPETWTILAPCPKLEVGDLIGRVEREWNDMVDHSPSCDLPAIAIEHCGAWSLSSEREALVSEVCSLVNEPDEVDVADAPNVTVEPPSPERKVLVVDDDREVNLCLGVRLQAAGFEVVSAYDGEEGVTAAIDQQPDAVVLDVRMPKKDGLTVLNELRANETTKNTPIVMLSASIRDQHRAIEEGANCFLSKPYDARTVLSAIESSISEEIPT